MSRRIDPKAGRLLRDAADDGIRDLPDPDFDSVYARAVPKAVPRAVPKTAIRLPLLAAAILVAAAAVGIPLRYNSIQRNYRAQVAGFVDWLYTPVGEFPVAEISEPFQVMFDSWNLLDSSFDLNGDEQSGG